MAIKCFDLEVVDIEPDKKLFELVRTSPKHFRYTLKVYNTKTHEWVEFHPKSENRTLLKPSDVCKIMSSMWNI